YRCSLRDCWCFTCILIVLIFFFSSRRRHTRFSRDWSSDVCSSDLAFVFPIVIELSELAVGLPRDLKRRWRFFERVGKPRKIKLRSEERRVGKECRTRWSPDQ